MRGVCDTCEQASEVFHAPGRTDLLCSECYINLGTALQLYQMLCESERAGGQDFELEVRLNQALRRLFSRVPLSDQLTRSVIVEHA
jgi:hypothetical protein